MIVEVNPQFIELWKMPRATTKPSSRVVSTQICAGRNLFPRGRRV